MRREAIVQQSEEFDHSSERLLAIVQQLAIELNPQRQDHVVATLESAFDRDLGIDSLGRAELLQRIEHAFGVTLSEQVLTTAETPADLLRALADANGRPPPSLVQTVAPAAVNGGRAAPAHTATLVSVLEFHLGAHPERPHIRLLDQRGTERTITYGDLWQGAQSVAAGLRDHGLEVG